MNRSRWTTPALLLSAALALSGGLPARAAPPSLDTMPSNVRAAAPGSPKDPVPVYAEDFENTAAPVRLTAYTGAAPVADSYTANAAWLDNCNGWVVDNSADSANFAPGITDCRNNASWWNMSRDLAQALGTYNGAAAPERNQAVTAFTAADPGANKVEFETAEPIPLTSRNRFITFSVDSAAMNCFAVGPSLKFFLMDGATAIPASDRGINPCTDPAARSVGSTKVVNRAADNPILFSGDQLGVRMINAQGSGSGNDAAFDNIRVLDVTPSVDKAFSPAVAPSGGTSTLTFTVTNTSDLYAKSGWSFTDNLPAGLTVADPAATSTTCTGGSVGATSGGTTVKLSGDLRAGQTSCTLSVQITADTGSYSNCAENVSDLVGVNAPDCATVEFQDPRYTISKTSSPAPGEPVVPGQKVDYTITVKNPGRVPVAATLTDDLTKVLDDAAYGQDARASVGDVTYADGKLDWSETLAPGAGATITYSVTVHDPVTGDGLLTNAVTGSDRSNCADATGTGCTTTVAVADLDIRKTSSARGTVKPGTKVTYTITLTNSGKGPYAGATFSDDLTDVVDDATYNNDAKATSGTVADTGRQVSWTGDVPAGDTVTLSYSVTVFTDPSELGDGRLGNAVVSTSPGAECPQGSTDPECATTNDVPTLTLSKSADPAAPLPGDTVTYTVTVTNDSDTAAYDDAAFTDDLTKVIDDATYNDDAQATGGRATYADKKLKWTGDIPAAGSVTVTYSVTINDPLTGDQKMTNTVTGDVPGTNCPAEARNPRCTTTTPIPSLTIRKTAAPQNPRPGDTITYTVTVTNDSDAPYPGATLTDDLADVLDDATYNDDARATTGTVTYTEPTLSWTGDLAPGTTATLTYTARVGGPGDGDGTFVNGLVGGPGSNCPAGTTDLDCRTVLPAPSYDFGDAPDTYGTTRGEAGAHHEIVDGLRLGTAVEQDTDGAPHGDADADQAEDALSAPRLSTHQGSVTLHPKVTNTTDRPALLVGWLDRDQDGEFEAREAVQATVPPGATSATLTWNGLEDLTADTTFLRLRLFGAESLGTDPTPASGTPVERAAWSAVFGKRAPGDPSPTGFGGPGEIEDYAVPVEAAHLVLAKTASTTTPEPGDTVTYTVTVASSGSAEYVGATFTDDLTGLLDDASYSGAASATAGTVSYTRPKLTWSGTVPAGKTVTVTYSVTVDDPVTGDRTMTNTVIGPDDSDCRTGTTRSECSTTGKIPPPTPSVPNEPHTPGTPDKPGTPASPQGHLPETGSSDAMLFTGIGAAILLCLGTLLFAGARRSRRTGD
ncbi:LPXTG cell wall anchor domain-containing protein [Streptomyces sp. Q6]|uniref:LPXTG cell wall anchor domain-containing protein n=1 Tax=Streptomyces citrinus TaxID=3118173 RepID=A0ACD5ANT1_9ACTN